VSLPSGGGSVFKRGVCVVFCNDCGFVSTGNERVCSACGHYLHTEPHISDITSGGVVSCDVCSEMNLDGSNFCRACGKKLKMAEPQLAEAIASYAAAYAGTQTTSAQTYPIEGTRALDNEYQAPEADEEFAAQIQPRHESLLEKLDRMEKELETRQNEMLPEAKETTEPDELDAHEEALKSIAYTLDSLIADLLEAEVREYAFPDFIHPDETGFPLKDTPKPAQHKDPRSKKERNLQEALVILALIAAIFLVGLSFGLWGSFFFGL